VMTIDEIAVGLTVIVVIMVGYFFYREITTNYLSNTKHPH